MANIVSLNTKIDLDEKLEFQRTTEALGMTPSSAIKVFVRMFNLYGGFPFDVRLHSLIAVKDAGIPVASWANGKLVVPASWRDEDDEDE